jgi:hypothetical protein
LSGFYLWREVQSVPMTIEDKARALLTFIDSLPDFQIVEDLDYGDYNHMGAVIVAAVLQAGLSWKTRVQTKVMEVIRKYPAANTTIGFLAVLDRWALRTSLAGVTLTNPIEL